MRTRWRGVEVGLAWLVFITCTAFGASAADEEAPAIFERPVYVPLKPAFVVNYGGRGNLRYLKVDISVRLKDNEAANSIRHHMPLIRHHLVMLLSKQTETTIDTKEAKELLRQVALQTLQTILEEEDGEQGVIDLFFNNFVVQR